MSSGHGSEQEVPGGGGDTIVKTKQEAIVELRTKEGIEP